MSDLDPTATVSLRDRLRAQVREDLEPLEVAVLPAFYGGALVATYRPATEKELDGLGRLTAQGKRDEANLVLLADTCITMSERHEDGSLHPIIGEDGVTASWNAGLSWYLDVEAATNHDLIRRVLKTPAAFREHAGTVMLWNRNPSGSHAEKTLGG